MAKSQRDPARESYWRNLLNRQRTSGLDARAFCRRQGLAESSFHFWRRTIRQRDAASPKTVPAFVPAVISSAATPIKSVTSTKPLPTVPLPPVVSRPLDLPAAGPGITIDLRGGRVLRLPASMSLAGVAELIRALEGDVSTVAGDINDVAPFAADRLPAGGES